MEKLVHLLSNRVPPGVDDAHIYLCHSVVALAFNSGERKPDNLFSSVVGST